ncbi:MAG: CHAD domain-containing protein [Paracoccaceae bacterium]
MTEKPAGLKLKMTPEDGFRRLAALCSATFSEQLRQVMTSEDPEGPHRARVALRRFRSALVGFTPVIDPVARREMAGQARALFRCLGRLRDADVLLAGCMVPDQVAVLAADADRIRAEVRDELHAMGAEGFEVALQTRLRGTDWQRHDKRGRRWQRRGLDRLGRRALERAWEACLAGGKGLTRLPDEARHEFRKELKTLRYLAEYFAPFWPGARRDRFLGHLRSLQDALGTLNDLALARQLAGGDQPDPGEATALASADASWTSLVKTGPWWD